MELIDFDNPEKSKRRWTELGFPVAIPDDAERVAYVNWASTAPGIDWPEELLIAPEATADLWILWSRNFDDPIGLERDEYPLAWYPQSHSREAAAQELVRAYWQAMWDLYQLGPIEEVEAGTVLSRDALMRIHSSVWSVSSQDG